MEAGNGSPPTVAEKREQDKMSLEKLKQEAYDFDPNTPPEVKAAQMKKVSIILFAASDHRPGCSRFPGSAPSQGLFTA